jgi:hypothetical protein
MNLTSTDPIASDTDSAATETEPGSSRPPKMALKTKIAAGLLSVGLLAAGGFALTQLGGSSASTSAASGAQGGPGGAGGAGGGRGGFGAGGGGAPVSGTISAVSASSISVKTASGSSTYKIAGGTAVQNNGATSSAAKLTVGEKVVVFTGAAPGANTSTTATGTASRILAGTSATQRAGAGTGAGTPPNPA